MSQLSCLKPIQTAWGLPTGSLELRASSLTVSGAGLVGHPRGRSSLQLTSRMCQSFDAVATINIRQRPGRHSSSGKAPFDSKHAASGREVLSGVCHGQSKHSISPRNHEPDTFLAHFGKYEVLCSRGMVAISPDTEAKLRARKPVALWLTDRPGSNDTYGKYNNSNFDMLVYGFITIVVVCELSTYVSPKP